MPVLFFLFWLILNASITAPVILTGVAVAALIGVLFYRFIGLNPKTELKAVKKIALIFAYLGMLMVEVIKANANMIKLVLSRNIVTNPQIKYFDSPVRSDIAKMALACTINLTPGTVFIELEDNKFGVHAIDAKFLVGMEGDWHIVKMLRRIEGGH